LTNYEQINKAGQLVWLSRGFDAPGLLQGGFTTTSNRLTAEVIATQIELDGPLDGWEYEWSVQDPP